MKFRLSSILSLAAAIALLSPACSDSDDPAPGGKLGVTVTAGSSTISTLTFTVTPTGAEKCAWVCIPADAPAERQTADYILLTGLLAPADKASVVTADNLAADKEYIILAAVKAGDKTAVSKRITMTTTPNSSDYIQLTNLVQADYSTDNPKGNGNYYIIASSSDDADGIPAKDGDVTFCLDLFAAPDADPVNATLPEGTYTAASEGQEAFTWNTSSSFVQLYFENQVQNLMLMNGTVTVLHTAAGYQILADLRAVGADENIKIMYEGPISFIQTGMSTFSRFTEPQTMELTISQGRYWGNWTIPLADDGVLEFFSGKFDDNGTQTEGWYVYVPIYMPKQADMSMKPMPVPNGTYTVYGRPVSDQTFVPYTIEPGSILEYIGQTYFTKFHIMHISADGKKQVGLIKSGEVSISGTGSQRTVTFDVETEEKVSIKGTYTGALSLTNLCDNSTMPERPWSDIDADVELQFSDDLSTYGYFLGNKYYMEPYNSWTIYMMPEQNVGSAMYLEFLTPVEAGREIAGEYRVSRDLSGDCSYTMLPGATGMGGASMFYSWYIDAAGITASGNVSVAAPIESGTMSIKKAAGGYEFVFDLKDDAGHALRGTWTGTVEVDDFDPWQQPSSVLRTMRKTAR